MLQQVCSSNCSQRQQKFVHKFIKLSSKYKLIKSSRADIIRAMMMGTETVPETLDFNELTRLSAREDFINFSRRESFTSYMFTVVDFFKEMSFSC